MKVLAPGSAIGKHPFCVVCVRVALVVLCGGCSVGVGVWGCGPLVVPRARALFVGGGGCAWVGCPRGGSSTRRGALGVGLVLVFAARVVAVRRRCGALLCFALLRCVLHCVALVRACSFDVYCAARLLCAPLRQLCVPGCCVVLCYCVLCGSVLLCAYVGSGVPCVVCCAASTRNGSHGYTGHGHTLLRGPSPGNLRRLGCCHTPVGGAGSKHPGPANENCAHFSSFLISCVRLHQLYGPGRCAALCCCNVCCAARAMRLRNLPPPALGLCRPKFQPPQSEGAGRGLVPLGDQETGEQTFCCPHPPPPTEMGPDRKQAQHPPPPACLRTLTAGRHMVIEVPEGADAERRV